ncbi:MAG: cobalamin biosynthesis protein, partial [Magnetococcales bacterium]|nr:cobalamin biosynthesis protein [Magnetococcales bacterium]
MKPTPALVAVTRGGAAHAARLARAWPRASLYALEPWATTAGATPLAPPLRQHVARLLTEHDPVCFFCALGAVVRLIAPHLRSKQQDPAVVVVDETARFVIPVVSGHQGGANEHARAIAAWLDALPVITTASDGLGLFAVDLLGREAGWRIEADPVTLTRCAAALVNGQPMALVQECGGRFFSLPENLEDLTTITRADPLRHRALLWITRSREVETIARQWPDALVIYRPPSLVAGIGCDRGTSLATLESALRQASAPRHRIEEITTLATIDRKGDEPALLALAEKMGVPLILFPAARLA